MCETQNTVLKTVGLQSGLLCRSHFTMPTYSFSSSYQLGFLSSSSLSVVTLYSFALTSNISLFTILGREKRRVEQYIVGRELSVACLASNWTHVSCHGEFSSRRIHTFRPLMIHCSTETFRHSHIKNV